MHLKWPKKLLSVKDELFYPLKHTTWNVHETLLLKYNVLDLFVYSYSIVLVHISLILLVVSLISEVDSGIPNKFLIEISFGLLKISKARQGYYQEGLEPSCVRPSYREWLKMGKMISSLYCFWKKI